MNVVLSIYKAILRSWTDQILHYFAIYGSLSKGTLNYRQVWLKSNESFSVSHTHSWLFGIVIGMPDFWSVDPWFKPHKKVFLQCNITLFFSST